MDRKSNRLAGYDYSTPGYYFVTVCARGRVPWFGVISDGEMALNGVGGIVAAQWEWLRRQYPYVKLDAYVVMPDHFHGIIGINAHDNATNVGNGRDRSLHYIRSPHNIHPAVCVINNGKIKPLPELIGAFKTTSSKTIRQMHGCTDFRWQKSFHDRIIRNERELSAAREYIINNPVNEPQNPARY